MRQLSIIQLPLILLLIMIAVTSYATPIKSLSDITTGSMIVESENNPNLLPLMDTQVTMKIKGLVAHVEVKQFFDNPAQEFIEATYYFPLPDDAAVDSMEMTIGDRRIIGKIKPKQEAKKIYQEARKEGKKVALLQQDRANLFRSKVANIAPGEVIEIKLSYNQPVQFSQGIFSLRFPSTITPRYQPSSIETVIETFKNSTDRWQMNDDPMLVQSSTVVAKESRNDHQLSIDVSLDAGMSLATIESESHAIVSQRLKNNRHHIRLQNYQVADRDFILQWTPVPANQPRLLRFNEVHESDPGYIYTQLVVVPPVQKHKQPLAREVTFIIDYSGSMAGESMLQAKLALTQAIRNLSPGDQFNVIGFNQKATSLFQLPVAVNQQSRDRALSYVSSLEAEGGTEMHYALDLALNEPQQPHYVRQIVFLTDGAVNNESQLFQLIEQQLGTARLFTIGIGSAPNSYFMRKAAEFGQGSYTYISDSNQVASKMTQLLQLLRYPVMQDIHVNFSEPVEYYPLKVPDLYSGQPLKLIIRRPAAKIDLALSGQRKDIAWQANIQLDDQIDDQGTGIARLWARQKMQQLLDQQIMSNQQEIHKDAIIEIALQHQLMSPYTSFIAVEERISRALDKTLKSNKIPNISPAGSQGFSYPTTSLNWQLQSFLATILLLFGIWLRGHRRAL